MHPEEPFLDPYHTCLSLAATSMFPPPESTGGGDLGDRAPGSVINAKLSTAEWATDHISYIIDVYTKKTRIAKFTRDVGMVRRGN